MPITLKQRLANASRPRAVPQVIPASVTGWNTRDALTAMQSTDAVVLDNWYPDAGGLQARNGYSVFASGLGGTPVNTLAEYMALGVDQLLAACGTSFYDISAGGSGTLLKTGFSSDKWQSANFNSKMFFVNGVDIPQIYDGTTLADTAFTGPTVTDIVGVNVFKNRLFFWLNNDDAFYYGGLNSISGALTRFSLATVSQSGGDLITMATMSHDGGNGIQDLAVFILSSGEVIIYEGNDPGDATAWSLVGRYKISPPVNVRSVVRYGADAYITTNDDHVPLSQQLVALRVGTVPPRSKASGAVQQAVNEGSTLFGWQAIFYPKGRRLLFNVPNQDGTFYQHVYNVSTDAWCRFTGMNATCWGLYMNNLYFGTAAGTVCLADSGSTDNGSAVVCDGQPAWNMFDDPRRKRLSAIRPLLLAYGTSTIQFGTNFDYQDITLSSSSSTINVSGSPWDTSPWDTSPWSSDSAQIDERWRSSSGSGYAVGFRLQATCLAPLSWLRTDCRYEIGSSL